jgi:hypothetical protein
MKIVVTPPLYAALRASLPNSEISFGCGGLHLYDMSEIEDAQVGYSIARDGTSLCGAEDGAWRPNWIVIGYETACGDPLFLETSNPALPVFTAVHGERAWAPVAVSISLEAFRASLKLFAGISVGRGNPVELNAKPLPDDERNDFLTQISALNNGEIKMDFWDVLLAG